MIHRKELLDSQQCRKQEERNLLKARHVVKCFTFKIVFITFTGDETKV